MNISNTQTVTDAVSSDWNLFFVWRCTVSLYS